jgi:uncharacterized membrane protein (DUF485 family)
MLPERFRRSFSIALVLLDIAVFFGFIESMFQIGLQDNLMQTGITLATVLAILHIFLAYLIIKHKLP